MPKVKKSYLVQYTGSIVLFIICLIIFFPVALILALKNMRILKDKTYLSLAYRGSYGWLIFWTIIFFPIALILLLINGVDVMESKT